VVEGSEAVGQAPGLLDDEVDGLGAAVADPVGVEAGQDVVLPVAQSAPEACDFGVGQSGKEAMTGNPLKRRDLRLVNGPPDRR
jgi:hypothetical protein